MSRRLPPRPFGRILLARATWLWVGLHMVSAMGMSVGGAGPEQAMQQGAVAAIWIWGFCVLGVHLVARRRGETMILANLGFSGRYLAALVLVWCVGLEACLLLVAGVVL